MISKAIFRLCNNVNGRFQVWINVEKYETTGTLSFFYQFQMKIFFHS